MAQRFTPIELAAYPVADILEALDYETYLARDRADFLARWNARRVADPSLPEIDSLALETDPGAIILQTGSYRETVVRARVNAAARNLTLAGALGRALDHIGATYYRTPRLDGEGDETYRRRLAIAPEAWSTAGPVGAYSFWALSTSADVRDVAVYSEDEGLCLAPQIRTVVLSGVGDGTASAALLAAVLAELRRDDRRPMGDLVTVESAVPQPFNVTVTVKVGAGASPAVVAQAATARVRAYCEGRRLWMTGDADGPVWLVGRTLRQDTIAAAAYVEGVEEVVINAPAGDVNAPDGSTLNHLLAAPILGTLTLNTEVV